MRARYRIVLAAAVLLLTLSELPLTFADQVYGRCTYGTPFWGCPSVADVSGIGIGAGLASLPLVLEEVARQMQQLAPTVQQPSQQPGMPTGHIEQPRQAGVPQTGAIRVDPKQQAQASRDRLVQQRRDLTEERLIEEATKRGWNVEKLEGRKAVKIEVSKEELLDFMKQHETALRNILGRDYDNLYQHIKEYKHAKLSRKLDLRFTGGGRSFYVEEKNVRTLSANKLNTLRELLIDIYLNVKGIRKIVWHFSEHSTGDFYFNLVRVFLHFRVEYWVGGGIPYP
ncbi:MAG: hypothetical protein QXU69_07660 [Thermofilaceae archaeon]